MKFKKSNNNQFYNGLKKRVDQYFLEKQLDRTANTYFWVKAAILVAVYTWAYLSILFSADSWGSYLLYFVLMGAVSVMIVFNIVHDSSHHAVTKNKKWNRYISYLGDLVGINTYIWDIRHNRQHHSFTNVLGGDLIIENIPLIRLSQHQTYKKFHRYQVYYVPFFYLLYSLYWCLVIDVKLFLAKDICNMHNIRHSLKEWIILVAGKLFYLTYMILIPWLVTPLSLAQVLLFFLFMHMAGGLVLSYVAVLGHFVEGPSFPDPVDGIIDNSWSEHELETTTDFSPQSRIFQWVTGGLNTHVAHHLFPHVCHVHYYDLTKIIEQYCLEHQYPYKKESFAEAVQSHFRYLKTLSKP